MTIAPSPSEALNAAVEQLYSTFARYEPTNIAWRSSYAGISDATVAKLESRALRELAVSDLDRYIRSAMITWGGVSEFKHFLPRIFELVTREPFAIDPLVFEKLDVAEWMTWPQEERDAVDTYVTTLWRWVLTISPDEADAGSLLRGIGLSGRDIEREIDVWRSDHSRTATEQLARLVLNVRDSLVSKTMPRQWHPKDHATVLAFLLEPDTKARIEQAFIESPEGESGRRLADASDVLAWVPSLDEPGVPK